MKIGMTELLVIFIVALVVIGPDKLPAYAKKLGEALRQFKEVSSEATKDIRESIVEPLEEAQRPLREACFHDPDVRPRAPEHQVHRCARFHKELGHHRREAPVHGRLRPARGEGHQGSCFAQRRF